MVLSLYDQLSSIGRQEALDLFLFTRGCRNEAREIGLKVVDAPPDVDRAMIDLLKFYMARDISFPKTALKPGQRFTLNIAWLDSTNKQMRVEQDTTVDKENQVRPVGDRWLEY